MNKRRQVDTEDLKNLVDSGMSRCMFGDWPRRKLLKLTYDDYDEAQEFWNPQEMCPSKILVATAE